MKVVLRIQVSDSARKGIGSLLSPVHLTQDGFARKAALVSWLEQGLSKLLPEFERLLPQRPILDQVERLYLNKVIGYLKSIGKTDQQIEDWILLQRARNEFGYLFPHVKVPEHVRVPGP